MSYLNCSNDSSSICCLLNIRSHQDYVCLEIDNYTDPQRSSAKRCLDSSQVIFPVFDKIRFNIKTAEPTAPFWFENKLEVYVEGRQLYPKRYCARCDKMRSGARPETAESSTNTALDTEDSALRRYVSNAVQQPCDKVEIDFDSHSNITSKETSSSSFEDFSQNSKSDIIILDCDDYSNCTKSISTCDVYTNENNEKSVQTNITLGKVNISENSSMDEQSDLSTDSSLNGMETGVFHRRLLDPLNRNKTHNNYTFINRMSNEVDAFDTLGRAKYWTLIETARCMMKMNRDVLRLNTLLKNSSEKFKCSEPIRALSPIQLVLNFKKSNRSGFYNFPKDMCDNKAWVNLSMQKEFCNSKYLDRLNETLSGLLSNKGNLSRCDEGLKNDNSLESLGLLQKRMLQLMEHFLHRSH